MSNYVDIDHLRKRINGTCSLKVISLDNLFSIMEKEPIIQAIPSADTSECTCCEYRVGDLCCYSDVDIKPNRLSGEWIETDRLNCGARVYQCSVCGEDVDEMPTVMGAPKYRFCPYCGAQMEGARRWK